MSEWTEPTTMAGVSVHHTSLVVSPAMILLPPNSRMSQGGTHLNTQQLFVENQQILKLGT